MFRKALKNQQGIGLLAAIFIVVIVGMFGVLLSRYLVISSKSSAEDLLWAQALYAAESGARLQILFTDGGGPSGWSWSTPALQGCSVTMSPPPNLSNPSDPNRIGNSSTYLLSSQASQAGVSRQIEVRYSLQ